MCPHPCPSPGESTSGGCALVVHACGRPCVGTCAGAPICMMCACARACVRLCAPPETRRMVQVCVRRGGRQNATSTAALPDLGRETADVPSRAKRMAASAPEPHPAESSCFRGSSVVDLETSKIAKDPYADGLAARHKESEAVVMSVTAVMSDPLRPSTLSVHDVSSVELKDAMDIQQLSADELMYFTSRSPVRVCAHECAHGFVRACVCARARTHTHVRLCAHAAVRMNVCVRACDSPTRGRVCA